MRVLAIAEQPDPAIPVLRTGEACEAGIGETLVCDDVATGVEFLVAVPLNLDLEFNEITVAAGMIDAATLSGIEVHFGTMEEFAYKFEVLRQLIARAMAVGEQVVIDVSVPDRPVIRNKNLPLAVEEPDAGEGADGALPEDELDAPADEIDEAVIEEANGPGGEEVWVE
jgi:hypothetical protein